MSVHIYLSNQCSPVLVIATHIELNHVLIDKRLNFVAVAAMKACVAVECVVLKLP